MKDSSIRSNLISLLPRPINMSQIQSLPAIRPSFVAIPLKKVRNIEPKTYQPLRERKYKVKHLEEKLEVDWVIVSPSHPTLLTTVSVGEKL